MTEICITGGTGFVGQHLARALPGAHLFRFPEQDLRNPEEAYSFITDYRPEILFHLAALSVVTNQDDMEQLTTNIAGTYNLLHACKRAGCVSSIVHISTDKVYGTNANARRTDSLRGVSHPYHASKLCGDIIAQMYMAFYGLPIRIVRMANIYGPGDSHFDRIIPGIITDALRGIRRRHRGDARFIRDYIYIDDLVPALVRIADEPPGIYNLGGEYYSARDVSETILRLMGREDLQPIWENNQHNEIPFQHIVDCPVWWQPVTSLEDGLERTIKWYRNNL